MEIHARVYPELHEIHVNQKITYSNESQVPLNEIYFNDWISSFSSPSSPLAKKFLNEFQTQLYIAKTKHRGFNAINTIQNVDTAESLKFRQNNNAPDVLKVELNKTLVPGDQVTLSLNYVLKIQSDQFTGYGISKEDEFFLNHWYLTPCVFRDNQWKQYSNYNFDDPYTSKSDVTLYLNLPKKYSPHSEFQWIKTDKKLDQHIYQFEGKNVTSHKLYLTLDEFKTFKVNDHLIQTNINHKKIEPPLEQSYFRRVLNYLEQSFGPLPESKLVLSKVELKKNSLYGLALLPDVLSPFSKEFEYDLVIAKNVIKLIVDKKLHIDPREDYWLNHGIQMVLLMDYIDTYYPDQKLIGRLSKVWGLRHFNFSKLNYNEQYKLTYQQMMRRGRDQAITLPKEQLLNFNERFTSRYKSAISLMYLNDYIGGDQSIDWLKEFANNSNDSIISTQGFRHFIERKTDKDLDWFFDEFLTQRVSADYKIEAIENHKDSTKVILKNLRQGAYPVTLTTTHDNTKISTQWIEGFTGQKTISLPSLGANNFVLNMEGKTPEFNLKNNRKVSKKTLALNKPLQFRLFRDVEDPNYNQIYLIPIAEFQNVYDGLKIGMNFNNQGLLSKPVIYAIIPTYGTQSKSFTGSAKIVFNNFYEHKRLYHSVYGLTLDRSSFNFGDFMTKFQPFAQFTFLDTNHLRSNELNRLTLRYINIQKDNSRSFLDQNDIPPYQVFNVRYMSLKNDIEDFKRWQLDGQISNDFGKLSTSFEIRKRTPKDRRYNLRIFAGAFVYNSLPNDETNFSFALDRPTDYLFEYNYLGQSESTGFLSQQLIVADGGFKSKLEPAFANRWMATLNASASIWRYIQAYGDVGLVKNNGEKVFFGYDVGIRIDLVTDFFELYFPVYSNLGWEISQPNYSDRIRFVFTTDLTRLGSLLTRRWF